MKISIAETQLMEALWRASPLTFDELVSEVGPANGWAATTVRTLVTRLLQKKAIDGLRTEAGYAYRPLLARTPYVGAESQNFLDRLFGGEVTPLVAALAQHRALTPADVEKLEALLAELKAQDHE